MLLLLHHHRVRFCNLVERAVNQMKTEAAVMKKEAIEMKDRITQLEIDRDSNKAIHELSNYTSHIRQFIAERAGFESWANLYAKTNSHSERNRICMSVLNSLDITEKQWDMIQDVSLELIRFKHKRIVAGAGEVPLNIIATSTEYQKYYDAFCRLVSLVETQILPGDV